VCSSDLITKGSNQNVPLMPIVIKSIHLKTPAPQ
jgi:hypothetical protein